MKSFYLTISSIDKKNKKLIQHFIEQIKQFGA